MKFSESWLRSWVAPPVDRDALCEQLTMAGLEVEAVEPVAGPFSGVVVARVEACERHPNADKLSLCTVADGEAEHQVICGAPNVRAGLTVAYARVGAVLPEDFKIKRAKLRGVESFGMLCSAAELGIGDDHDGILELDDALTPGMDLREALALDDAVIELSLTPNRGDCLGLRGLAREVAVLNDVAVCEPEVAPVPPTLDEEFPVRLSAPEACPRYLGRVLRGIDISRPSPLWLKERLRRSGLRSIDAVVDVTNYVMLELGQPMHAFDLNRLSGGIDVRAARPGEILELLDGQTVTLDPDVLLIADDSGPVAMAGVMGGERSGVQADSRDLFLECAFFSPVAIAGTARRFGLHTDASHRYERGVDYELQNLAMERATALLLDIVGGSAGPVRESVAPERLPTPARVALRQRRVRELLGVDIAPADVDRALARLGFAVQAREDEPAEGVIWRIEAPSHRFDIAIEADLLEEVCRIHGYNNIASRLPETALELRRVPLQRTPEAELKRRLCDLGYQEAITLSFVDPGLQDLLDPGTAPLTLSNPMSSEQSVMRTNLFPGLLAALQHNLSRQQQRVRLFETGLRFVPGRGAGGELAQIPTLAGVLYGSRGPEHWQIPAEAADFFDLKGDIEQLLALGGAPLAFEALTDDPVLHPGRSARVLLDGRPAGRLGELHPELVRRLDLEAAPLLFELDADEALSRQRRRYRSISRFPSVRRDLAVVMAAEVPAAALEACLRETLGGILTEFILFDVYQGKGIDSNEKSVALGLTFQDPSATLDEARISALMNKALTVLAERFGARQR